ncbi:thiopeptide-type bacteriocin biosynthesis protein [Streptomyces sp. NPDC089799]|uniref:thiopeptide-type bacteriocin biosynthesis protein n=1 Tax=Streptomyces sp. NPDC089799 TaxID=3155066 RepID=UPI0034299BC3
MSTPAPNPDGWLSWHVHVPADAEGTDRLTPLVREQLPALLAPLREAGLLHRWFFIRYWEGGPHLRIRLLPQPGAGRAATPDALDAAVRRAFADVPREGHDPEGYLASIGDLAAASVVSDPTVDRRLAATVLPPGVHAADYVPETDRYGTGAALEATEEVFTLSSELALRAARSELDDLRLRLLGTEVLLKAAALADDGVRQEGGPAADDGEADPAMAQLRAHADYWSGWSRSAPQEVFPTALLAQHAADWAQLLLSRGRVNAPALTARASAVSPWAEALAALLPLAPTAPARSGLLISHTHMTLNRMGIFVHDEYILAEAAARLLRAPTGTPTADTATVGTATAGTATAGTATAGTATAGTGGEGVRA